MSSRSRVSYNSTPRSGTPTQAGFYEQLSSPIHSLGLFGVKMSQVSSLRFVAWRRLWPNRILRVRTSQAHQVKRNMCFDAPSLVLAKRVWSRKCCRVCSMSTSILAPKLKSVLNILSSSTNFCTNSPPYDPEKDAFLQDILKEFGRDFSSETKKSGDGVSGEIDSGYESDSDTNLEKSTGTSSSSSSSDSDTDSDLNDKSSNTSNTDIRSLNDRGQDAGKWPQSSQVLEAEVKHGSAECEEDGTVSAEVKEDTLEGYEEIEAYSDEDEEVEEIYERVHVVPLERGEAGVFDIEELVAVLRDENAIDLIVMEVPERFNYVDYMVVASGRSVRHIRAMAEYLKLLHKKKKGKKDLYLKIEGLDAKDWVAMDFGNIALHLFMPATREIYDLESLWAVGRQYDNQTKQQEVAYAFLFDQQVAGPGMSLNQSSETAFSSDFRQQGSDDGEKDSYEMHSDQWHQVETTNFENKTDVER